MDKFAKDAVADKKEWKTKLDMHGDEGEEDLEEEDEDTTEDDSDQDERVLEAEVHFAEQEARLKAFSRDTAATTDAMDPCVIILGPAACGKSTPASSWT